MRQLRSLWPSDLRRHAPIIAVLLLAAALRFWNISGAPGFDWDEPVYASIGAHVASGAGIFVKAADGATPTPYLFHPPFYFLLLGGWFKVVGSGIVQARVLAATASLMMGLLLYRFLRNQGRVAATLIVFFVLMDTWITFENRISWIENLVMPLGVLALILYQRAVQSNQRRDFLIAGLALGGVAIFKHVAVYFLLTAVIYWLLAARRNTREHGALLLAAGAVIVLYAVGIDIVTHGVFATDSFVQLQRTLGATDSRGNVVRFPTIIQAFLDQYAIFVPTMLVAGVSAVLAITDGWRMAVQRLPEADVTRRLVCAWVLAALTFFLAISLKFPHYFIMSLVPLYVYLGIRIQAWLPSLKGKHQLAVLSLCALLLAYDAFAYTQRFVLHHDNALAAVALYMQQHAPANAVVLTEESIGAIIPQAYCLPYKAYACPATYIITYTSLTQGLPTYPAYQALLQHAVKVATFTGFKETITVYRIVLVPSV